MSAIDKNKIQIHQNLPNYAFMGVTEMEQLCKLLSHRQKYAKFYLEHINVDKDATIASIDQINNLIKEFLGL